MFKSSDRLDEIDGLRAIAVLAVVIFHFEKRYLPLGYLGVDIFFAISGYVITKSILERMDAGVFTINDFFMRRAKRLLPALAAVVVVSIIVATLLLPGKRAPLGTGAAAFVGMSNIMLWIIGTDYFASAAEWNPLTHTWSLGVEEQFYLIFPFMMLLVRGLRSATLLTLGGAGLISLAFYVGLGADYQTSVFYLTPFRLWELMGGALIYLTHRYWGCLLKPAHQNMLKYGFLCGLLAVLCSDRLPEHVATILCVLGSCGVLYLSGQGSKRNPILLNPISVFIGKISYSLYLWHWPVAVFSKLILPPELVLAAYVGLTSGLSLLSFYTIERPFRRRAWTCFRERFILTFPSYAAGAAAIVAGVWIGNSAFYLGPSQMLEIQFLRGSKCHIPDHSGLVACLEKNAERSNRGTIWLIGDSHAGNYKIALQKASETLGVRFQFLTGRSLFNSLASECSATTCPEGSFADLATRLKAVSISGDVVIISFARDRFQDDAGWYSNFQYNLDKFIRDLRAAKLNVVLVEDIPKVCNDDGDYFKSAFRRESCSTSAAQSRSGRSKLSAIYRAIQEQQAVRIIDPHDRLCKQTGLGNLRCSNWLGDELLYLDASPHLTFRASASLAEFFSDELNTNEQK